MDDNSSRPPEIRKRRQRPSFGAGLALFGLLVIGVLAVACGDAPKDQGGPSAARTSTTTSTITSTTAAASGSSGSSSSAESSQAEELRLAQCMRVNGVPNFPDPPANGAFLNALGASGVNPRTPGFQSALQACKRYDPAGNVTPAEQTQNAQGLKISQCMRSHGVPNFPDPTIGPLGEQVMNLRGTGIDPTSPTVQAASQACQKLFPGSK